MSNLLAAQEPKDTPLNTIISSLEKHYNSKPLEIAESFQFGTRNQKEREPISDYIVALKKLSLHCNYGDFFDRALRNRFVCGLTSTKIQNKLLNTETLTFEKARLDAGSMKKNENNIQEFRPVQEQQGIMNEIRAKNNPRRQTDTGASKVNEEHSCFRCGGNHVPGPVNLEVLNVLAVGSRVTSCLSVVQSKILISSLLPKVIFRLCPQLAVTDVMPGKTFLS